MFHKKQNVPYVTCFVWNGVSKSKAEKTYRREEAVKTLINIIIKYKFISFHQFIAFPCDE